VPLAEPVLITVAGLFGAMLGSFLNVCVHRLPRDESVVRPRSRCPRCGAPIAWYDNVPIVSWLLLRGRCRHCREPISVQYPLVELAVAATWAGSVAWYGISLAALAAALLVTLLLGILLTDARHMIIPDELSLGGLGAGLALSLLPGGISPLRAGLGAALGYGLLWAAGAVGKWWAGREAMGGGDLKMMAMVGSFLGWQGVLLTVFLGSLVGTVVFLPALLRRERYREIPFGVFLAVGAAVTLVAGPRLVAWYRALVTGGP
jgi:leader peptidase (prepilin peptidase)/N-methyltransferase